MIPEYAKFLKYDMRPYAQPSNFEQTLRAVLDAAKKPKTHRERDIVERVVNNPPATIVFWKDKTKTVVKQQDGDVYDPEKGFMAACTKKFFGNDNQFNYEIKWYVPKQEQVESERKDPIEAFANVVFGGTYSGPKC